MSQPEWWLGADSFMRPSYRISPFSTASMTENRYAPIAANTQAWMQVRFPTMQFNWTQRGSQAITIALQNLALKHKDVVTILTTTGNRYVSGCVTRAIEQVCSWNRDVSLQTTAILVVHEFGAFYRDMSKIYDLGLPVIEDYAHCFTTTPPMASQADYIVFSLPKFIPVQYGGILLSKTACKTLSVISKEQIQYLDRVVSHAIPHFPKWCAARVANYHRLARYFSKFGCPPFFEWQPNEIPSVFMFKTREGENLHQMKLFMQNGGIESSIFYGESAFFLPVHHNLTADDLDYFAFVWEEYIQQQRILTDAH